MGFLADDLPVFLHLPPPRLLHLRRVCCDPVEPMGRGDGPQIRGYPLEAANSFSVGMLMLNAGEYEASVYTFSVAITLDPDHWTAYFRRAEAYHQPGMEEQANADLERAEFLKAAARQETAAKGATSGDAGTHMSGGSILGAIVGGMVGEGALLSGIIAAPFLGGYHGGYLLIYCIFGIVICGPIVGIVGGIVGGVLGGAIHRRLTRYTSGEDSAVSGMACLGAVGGVIAIIGLYIFTAKFP